MREGVPPGRWRHPFRLSHALLLDYSTVRYPFIPKAR